jgi:hypothetical protein
MLWPVVPAGTGTTGTTPAVSRWRWIRASILCAGNEFLMEEDTQRKRRPRRMNGRPKWLPFQPDPEKDRYYLLPGMGGKLLKKKRRMMMRASVAIGLLAAGILGYIMYKMNVR